MHYQQRCACSHGSRTHLLRGLCCRPDAREVSDDFFEFTAEDLARVTAAHIGATSSEAPLMTRAIRERRQEAAASQYGPVPVRILFPGDLVVQVPGWQAVRWASLSAEMGG